MYWENKRNINTDMYNEKIASFYNLFAVVHNINVGTQKTLTADGMVEFAIGN